VLPIELSRSCKTQARWCTIAHFGKCHQNSSSALLLDGCATLRAKMNRSSTFPARASGRGETETPTSFRRASKSLYRRSPSNSDYQRMRGGDRLDYSASAQLMCSCQ